MPTLMEMLEAGVHFGHKKERSHPKMKDYTYAMREGIFVIDLEKTQEALKNATDFLKKELSLGKTILFVATKRQAKEIVQNTAELAGMPFITKRWLGGTLTNFETVRKSIAEMDRLEVQVKSPEFEAFTKKEKKVITDKLEKLQAIFGGIKDLKNLPDTIFVVDANREKLAIEEASKMKIPVVAVADTDADPTKIDYLIPANEDAAKSIDLIMKSISEVFSPLKKKAEPTDAENMKVEEMDSKETEQKEEVQEKAKIKKAAVKKSATKKKGK